MSGHLCTAPSLRCLDRNSPFHHRTARLAGLLFLVAAGASAQEPSSPQSGRSRAVTGPCLDRGGIDLRDRSGTLVLAGEDRWIGPGHASIDERNGRPVSGWSL